MSLLWYRAYQVAVDVTHIDDDGGPSLGRALIGEGNGTRMMSSKS